MNKLTHIAAISLLLLAQLPKPSSALPRFSAATW